MASSMRKRMTRDFQKQIYKTCGIHTLILTAYRDEKRDVRVSMSVTHQITLTICMYSIDTLVVTMEMNS